MLLAVLGNAGIDLCTCLVGRSRFSCRLEVAAHALRKLVSKDITVPCGY